MAAQYRMPIKRSPKADPQQYRVYRMENEAIGARRHMRLKPSAIEKLVRSVCRNYGVKPPKVRWKYLGKWAAEWDNDRINLNPSKGTSRDILTVTHELAHHIHYCISLGKSEEQQPHGPQFMACHISILDTCRIIPVVGMRAICKKWKVAFCDPGESNSLATLRRIARR